MIIVIYLYNQTNNMKDLNTALKHYADFIKIFNEYNICENAATVNTLDKNIAFSAKLDFENNEIRKKLIDKVSYHCEFVNKHFPIKCGYVYNDVFKTIFVHIIFDTI